MAEITTLFWDVSGVILTNGWDRVAWRVEVEPEEQGGIPWNWA